MDTDYRAVLTEEVALEGLDGITLQALWVRLENRSTFKMRLDEKSKEFLWCCLLSIPDLQFYQLETPRGNLSPKQPITMDPESGVTVDFDLGEDLYPIKIIKEEGPVIGSCSTYYTRQCVTKEINSNDSQDRLTLKEVEERYGNSLVIVASQEQRFTALCGEELDPSSIYNLTEVSFCIMERIGRSRRAGELSIGESSLQVFNVQPKSMFYHTLRLIKLGILKKQSITVYNKKGQNSLRRLFHLTRFYQQYQSKYTILSNLVANYLSDKPMKRQEISKARQECGIDQKSFKKLYQSYNKRFRVSALPYNEFYPESPESNWYTKKADIKMVRVIELMEEEDSDEDEDEEGKIDDISKDEKFFPQVYEKSVLRQAMEVLEEAGTEGVSQSQMMKRLCLDSLETRMILRTMERRGVVTSLMIEVGKQKKKVMVSKSFVGGNKLINQINQEKEKLKQSLQDINNKQGKESPQKSVKEIEIGEEVNSAEKKKEKLSKKSENDKIIEDEVQGIVHNVNTSNRHFRTEVRATCRQMKRINYILDFIRENKIVDGVFPVVKMIREKEQSEKFDYVVDKKTVFRLLSVLAKEKKINIVNTVLVDGNKKKNMQMLMSKEIDPTDQIVTSLINQANMKFQAVNREQVSKKNPKSRDFSDIPETAKEGFLQIMSHRSKLKAGDMIYDVAYSKHYDFRPKFSRAQILHTLLWYLVYGYPDSMSPPQNVDLGIDPGTTPDQIDINTQGNSVGNDEDIMTLINRIPKPPVYKDEMSWKRFLSPLPKHKGYGEGWFLASDILLKLPLVIFCNILYIPYRIRGLKELLEDPEKCFYPVISLPTPITQQLLYARKYIYSFYGNCVNLCNMGLVTMGPQILKEKDKIFIYLHKKVTLLDTKASEPGFCKVKLKESPVCLEYSLVTPSMVDQYWVDLKHIALNSNVGHKNKRDDEVEPNSKLLALPDSRSVESLDDIKEDGFVPGDRLGAAGLDSNTFPHLFRNWSGVYSRAKSMKCYRHIKDESYKQIKGDEEKKPEIFFEKRNYVDLQKARNTKLSMILPRPKERVALNSREKSPEVIRVTLTKMVKGNKGGKGIKRKPTEMRSSIPTKRAKTLLKKVKKNIVKPRKRKILYDDIDQEAFKRKLSQRVSWSSYEDSLLLTSKIATLVMDRKRRGVLIPWSCIRDVLYHYAPKESVDKTSCACQRRVTHSLKNPSTKQNLMIYLSEAMQDPYVRTFSEKQYLQASDHAMQEFHVLVNYLVNKFSNVKLKKTYMPDSLSQVNDYDITCVTQYTMRKLPTPEEPDSRAKILEYILKNIIHSYVSSAADKQGRSHQMFKLLSQYPDSILDSAIQQLRVDGVIVKNKTRDNSNVIETGIRNIKLSQRYFFRFHSRYPTSLFANCFTTIKELLRSDEGKFNTIRVKDTLNGGLCAIIVQLILSRQITIDMEIPSDIVILDPHFKHGRGYNPQMSLAKRARLQEVLDSDDEDYPLDLDQKEVRPSVLEQESPWELVRRFDGPSPFIYDEDGKTIKQHSAGSRSTIRFQKDDSLEDSKKGKEKSKMNTMCASRALVTMRRSRAEQDQELRHYNVQDNFLIQACDIKLRVHEENVEEKEGRTGVNLTLLDMPYNGERSREIIKRVQSFIPFELDLEEVWSTVEPRLIDAVKSVYSLIHCSGELGICHFHLKNVVNDWELFQLAVGHLLSKKAILRVGITTIKYVSLPHSRPWVIHNYRDTRGRGQHREMVADAKEDQLFISKESLDSTKDGCEGTPERSTNTNAEQLSEKCIHNSSDTAGSVEENSITSVEDTRGTNTDLTTTSNDKEIKNNMVETVSVPDKLTTTKEQVSSVTTQTEIDTSLNTESETTDGLAEAALSGRRGKQLITTRLGPYTRSRSPKRKLLEDNDSIPVGPKASSTYEKIRLQIMPWKKPEGYLNKPVFSFMLQSLLLYIVSNPGISFTNICGRYLPYLMPCHLMELLEILGEIGCLSKTILTKELPLSVFSSYQAPVPVSEKDQSAEDSVCYEATISAFPLLAQFLEDVQNTDSVQLHRTRKRTQSDIAFPKGENHKGADQQHAHNTAQEQVNSSETTATYSGDVSEVSTTVETSQDSAPDRHIIQTVASFPVERGNDAVGVSGRQDIKIESNAGDMILHEGMDIDPAPETAQEECYSIDAT